jgi:hypothetical protein
MTSWLNRAVLGVALSGSIALAAQTPAVSPATADKLVNARRILEQAQQSAGGRAKLTTVRDLTRTADLLQAGTASKAQQIVKVIMPRTIRLFSEVNGVTITAFSDGTRGWATSPWGVDEVLPAWQLKSAHLDMLRQPEVLLTIDSRPEMTIEPLERRELDTGPADGIRITSNEAPELSLWVDVKSGEPVRLEFVRPAAKGRGAFVVERYSDFRTVGGIRTPFKTSLLNDGVPYMDTLVTKVEYNTGLTLDALNHKDPPKGAPAPPPPIPIPR